MSKWFTCSECNRQFEYVNEQIAQDVEKALDGDQFLCDGCGGVDMPLPDAIVTQPYGMKLKISDQSETRGRGISGPIA